MCDKIWCLMILLNLPNNVCNLKRTKCELGVRMTIEASKDNTLSLNNKLVIAGVMHRRQEESNK